MKDRILEALEGWVAGGKNRMGELLIRCAGDGAESGFDLRHFHDIDREDLEFFSKPEAARLIASTDDADEYRPLKSAPNLRHGWRLALRNLEEVKLALDFFYPAMLGTLLAWQENRLGITNFRDTANRQSGMYALVKKIGNAPVDELIGKRCRLEDGCLKRILWKIDQDRAITSLSGENFIGVPGQDPWSASQTEIPLICSEACNLLIAAARQVVKGSPQ